MSNKAKRIIFYRIGAIGDIVHTLPLIKYIKKQNPNTSIELILGSKQMFELLKLSALYIDKLWLIDHNSPLNKPIKLFLNRSQFLTAGSTELELYESIQLNPVDEFVYLHSNLLKANLINLFFIKASQIFVYKNRPELSAVVNYAVSYLPDLESLIRENSCGVLDYRTLAIKAQGCGLWAQGTSDDDFAPSPEPRAHVCIVLGVGNLRPSRAYPLQKWIWLIEKILQETEYEILILGGPDEKDLSTKFEKILAARQKHLKMGDQYSRIKNLIGKTDLLELASLITGTKKLYSADTGILHIAASLDIPIESVFTITLPQRFGPFNPNANVLSSRSCACISKSKYKQKHCTNLIDGYAQCAWACEFSV